MGARCSHFELTVVLGRLLAGAGTVSANTRLVPSAMLDDFKGSPLNRIPTTPFSRQPGGLP